MKYKAVVLLQYGRDLVITKFNCDGDEIYDFGENLKFHFEERGYDPVRDTPISILKDWFTEYIDIEVCDFTAIEDK